MKSFTGIPADAFGYGPLLAEDGAILVTPKRTRPAKDHFVVTPEEHRQKEDWDTLKGTLLHVPRAVLPETDEDEVYIDELLGLLVVDEAGKTLGKVKAVQNYGAGDLLDIAPATDGKSVLVPFTEEDVPEVDLKVGRITVVTYHLWADDSGKPEVG